MDISIMSDFNGCLTESNGIKIEWSSVMTEGYVKTPFQLYNPYTPPNTNTHNAQNTCKAGYPRRISLDTIISHCQIIVYRPQASFRPVRPLSVFVLTIDLELSSSQSLFPGLDSILPLSYVV